MLVVWLSVAGVVLALVRWRARRRFRKAELTNVTEGRMRPERGGF